VLRRGAVVVGTIYDYTTQRRGFDSTHIRFFFWHNKPKTLSERGAQAPVDVVDVDALSERGPQARVDGVDVVEVVLGVK
jgi:hypothetical protein